MTTVCKNCNREFTYSKKKGHSKSKCNSCLVTARRLERNEKIYAYKGNKCEICGYDTCKRALCFHHKDPKQKNFRIANSWGKSWVTVKNELDKCVLLCSNCHAELHNGNNPTTITITAAAIKSAEGVLWSLPPPARHHNIIHAHYSTMGKSFKCGSVQGFITNKGKFADRIEASKIALVAGQVSTVGDMLFSEDLW